MSSKVFAAALAVLAMQALCSQASSIRPAEEDVNDWIDIDDTTSDVVEILMNLNLAGDNKIVASEITKDVQGILNSLDLAGNEKTRQSLGDGAGLVQTLQNILNSVNTQIQKSYRDEVKAVDEALKETEKTTENLISTVRASLESAIGETRDDDPATEACLARQQTIRSVAASLRGDVQTCVQRAFSGAQDALRELEKIPPEVEILIEIARSLIAKCPLAGVVSGSCVLSGAPSLLADAASLARNATVAGLDVTRATVAAPLRTAVCVRTAATQRGQEASVIIQAIAKCIADRPN